jgi:hypothetical protein
VTGILDFEGATLTVPLRLDHVDIGEPINLEQAQGSAVEIIDSRLAGVSADQLRLEHSLVLRGSTIDGPVKLRGATSAAISNVTGRRSTTPAGTR